MTDVLLTLLRSLSSIVKTRAALQIEIVARSGASILLPSSHNAPKRSKGDQTTESFSGDGSARFAEM